MADGPIALLLSTGGSPAPLIASIDRQRPSKLIFFVSPQTRANVRVEILGRLPADCRYDGVEYVETPSAELLDECYRALVTNVPRILDRWELGWGDLRADFTGGTKAMSAAVVLALAGKIEDFSYVGAEDALARDKGGVGIVLDGKERLLVRNDPWSLVAEYRLGEAVKEFRSGDFAAAALEARQLARDGKSHKASSLAGLFEGFALWDAQRYEKASAALSRAVPVIETAAEATDTPRLKAFAAEAKSCSLRLDRVRVEAQKLRQASVGRKQDFGGVDGLEIPKDLCAAAIRRVETRHDAEDGVLLLYAAVEKLARGRLLARHGINNSGCPIDCLGSIREHILERQRPEDGKVKLALTDSFRLLDELGDEVGRRFKEHGETLKKLGSARNECWREHGYSHVEEDVFRGLLPQVLVFLGATETDLVRFPEPVLW